jgi:adenylate cyclase
MKKTLFSSPRSVKYQKQKLLWAGLVFSCALVGLLFSIPFVGVQEWRMYDFWMHNENPADISQNVAVVGIDEDFFEVLGFAWPLAKDEYAKIMMMLDDFGARVTAFDIIFIDRIRNDDDYLFTQYLSHSPSVIPGYGFVIQRSEGGRGIIPGRDHVLMEKFSLDEGNLYFDNRSIRRIQRPYDEILTAAHHAGFINRAYPMPDGVDRKMPLVLSANSRVYPSLALQAAALVSGDSLRYDSRENSITLGDRHIDLNSEYGITVNFKDSIPFYPLSSLYQKYNSYLRGDLDSLPEIFKGKAVFVGSAAETVGDLGLTPVSSKHSGGRAPIVKLHAQTAHTVLKNTPIRDLGYMSALLLSFGMLFLLYIVFSFFPKKYLFAVIPVLFIGLYTASYLLFHQNIFLPMGQAFVSLSLFTVIGIIVDYLEDNREYKYLTSLFKTYLSPQYIEEMAHSHTIPKLGGEDVYGTAFFTDIEKFSTFSEKFEDPRDLVAILNTYFSTMTTILLDNKGTLDRYSGDAIIAFFGAPQKIEKSASYACKTACEMQEALRKLSQMWREDPRLSGKVTGMNTRIGINTGRFVTGNIGCDIRMNYTMIGDSVNLAARLESAAKQYGVWVLVGENTYEEAGDKFLFREIDQITVVGKNSSVRIYELISPGDISADKKKRIVKLNEAYGAALKLYYAGDFSAAADAFKTAAVCEFHAHKTTPSAVMEQRCRKLVQNPPKDWDGVYSMKRK